MPDLTERDFAEASREQLVHMLIEAHKDRAFLASRHDDVLGRCNELLEETRGARAREREARRIIEAAIDGAALTSGCVSRTTRVDTPIVAVSGKAGSGKSTVAGILGGELGLTEVSLATPLKALAEQVFLFTRDQLYGPSECRDAVDYRYDPVATDHAAEWEAAEEALFEHGPAWLDEVGLGAEHMPALRCWFDDLVALCVGKWGRRPMDKFTPRKVLQTLGVLGRDVRESVWVDYAIARAAKAGAGAVIPDARFENELAAVRAAGGVCVRVKRAGAGLSGKEAEHASETEQDAVPDAWFDAVLDNDGTIDALAAKAVAAVGPWLAARRRAAS